MPKLKTHRGAAKRFKKTASGKFMRSKAFKRHILTSKSRSRKRGLRGTFVVAKPDQVDRFMSMLLENAKAARETEPGCRQFDVLVDPKDRTRVMLYEVYEDDAAFQAHQQTPHFKRYIAEAIPLLQSRDRFFFRRVAP